MKDNKPVFFLNFLLLTVGCQCSLYPLFDMFGFPYKRLMLGAVFLFTVLFTGLFSMTGKKKILALAGFLGIWALMGYWLRASLAQGAVVSFNYLVTDIARFIRYEYGEVLPPTGGEEWLSVFFCLYVLFPYTCLLTWAVVFGRNSFISLLLTIPVFAFVYSVKSLPGNLFLYFLLLFWIAVFMQPGALIKKHGGNTGAPFISIGVTAVLLLIVFVVFPKESYVTSPATYAVRRDLIDFSLNMEYAMTLSGGLPGFSGGAPLTSNDGTVNLNNKGSLNYPDMDILRVYSEAPHNLYLRAYSAAIYTGSRWMQPGERVYAGAGIPIEPMMYMETVRDSYYIGEPALVTVEPMRAGSRFLFTPYLLTGVEEANPPAEWRDDSYLPANRQTAYTFKSYAGTDIDILVTGMESWGLRYLISPSAAGLMIIVNENESRFNAELDAYQLQIAINFARSFDELRTEGFYSNYIVPYLMKQGSIDIEGQELAYYSSVMGPWFSDSANLPEDALYNIFRYFNNPPDGVDTVALFYPEDSMDYAYMEYISQEYTQLPDGLREVLLEWWAENKPAEASGAPYGNYEITGSNTPYWSWAPAAHLVAEAVKNSGEYTTSPGVQPINRDFVEYFLTTGNKGYCVHFASATVAVLRALGVPARYVEGYVVKEAFYDENGWASVPADSAHAWAEIWVPNFGWVPVDATPGSSEMLLATAGSNENAGEAMDFSDMLPEMPFQDNMPLMEDEYDGRDFSDTEEFTIGGRDNNKKFWNSSRILILLLVTAASCGILALLYGWVMHLFRLKQFSLQDTNKSALYIYTYLSRMAPYGARISDNAAAVALKARFSNHHIEPEELSLLRSEFELWRDKLWKKLDGYKKFVFWLSVG